MFHNQRCQTKEMCKGVTYKWYPGWKLIRVHYPSTEQVQASKIAIHALIISLHFDLPPVSVRSSHQHFQRIISRVTQIIEIRGNCSKIQNFYCSPEIPYISKEVPWSKLQCGFKSRLHVKSTIQFFNEFTSKQEIIRVNWRINNY